MTAGKNLLIVGGGSNLFNLQNLSSMFFGCNVKVLSENDNDVLEEDLPLSFSGCIGALKIIQGGFETEAVPNQINPNRRKLGIFHKLFGILD